MKEISCLCAFKSFAFVIYLSNGHWSKDVFLQLTIVISVVYLRYTMERVLCMYLDWFGMHFPKSKMVSYRSVQAQAIQYNYFVTPKFLRLLPQNTYLGVE